MSPETAIRGNFFVVVIACVFGYWQNNWIAGLFMLLLLLFLAQLGRVLIVGKASEQGAVNRQAEIDKYKTDIEKLKREADEAQQRNADELYWTYQHGLQRGRTGDFQTPPDTGLFPR